MAEERGHPLGKYELFGKLGEGPNSVVFRARDVKLNQEVAVKVLKPSASMDPAAFARFAQTAQNAYRLFHPHIATVSEVGKERERVFIVARYVPGRSLKDWIQESGPLTWEWALSLVNQVGSALDAGHQQGIMHRNLKPANICCTPQGEFFITDFGLAAAFEAAGLEARTSPYTPPENLTGQIWTVQADLYSLALVLVEALTGKRPGTSGGDTLPGRSMRSARSGPELPPAWPAGIPAGLNAVLARALAREPGQRFASAQQFYLALAGLGQPAAVPANRPLAAAPAAPVPAAPRSHRTQPQPEIGAAGHVAVEQSNMRPPAGPAPQPVGYAGPSRYTQGAPQSAGGEIPWKRVAPVAGIAALVLVMILVVLALALRPATETASAEPTRRPVSATPPLKADALRVERLKGIGAQLSGGATLTEQQSVPNGALIASGEAIVQLAAADEKGSLRGRLVLFAASEGGVSSSSTLGFFANLKSGGLYIQPEKVLARVDLPGGASASVSGSRLVVKIAGADLWLYCLEGNCLVTVPGQTDPFSIPAGSRRLVKPGEKQADASISLEYADLLALNTECGGCLEGWASFPTPTPRSTLTVTVTRTPTFYFVPPTSTSTFTQEPQSPAGGQPKNTPIAATQAPTTAVPPPPTAAPTPGSYPPPPTAAPPPTAVPPTTVPPTTVPPYPDRR